MKAKAKSIEEILAFLTTHQFDDKWGHGIFRFRRLYWDELELKWNAPIEDEVGNGYNFFRSHTSQCLKKPLQKCLNKRLANNSSPLN